MWTAAGVALLDMERLRVSDLALVEEAASLYERRVSEGG